MRRHGAARQGREDAKVGVPVLDGVACAVKLLEAVVDYGLRTSRVAAFKQPEPKEIPRLPRGRRSRVTVSPDVVVVGGGVVGACAALELARRGAAVTLLERGGELACGPAGPETPVSSARATRPRSRTGPLSSTGCAGCGSPTARCTCDPAPACCRGSRALRARLPLRPACRRRPGRSESSRLRASGFTSSFR